MNLNPMTLIRRRAYRATFNTVEGRKVLADLRRFCRASVPTADVNNVQATYLLEGQTGNLVPDSGAPPVDRRGRFQLDRGRPQ